MLPVAPPPRCSVLGVGVSVTTYAGAADVILAAARHRQAFAGTALAVHGVMTGRLDLAQRARLNGLDLVTPDGQPVRWALNWLHRAGLAERVYGPFLMLTVCERAAAEGLGVFLYGSNTATLEQLARELHRRFPTLRVSGKQPSRFRRATETEWLSDVATLQSSGADIVFCGIGCPRQEVWAHEMRAHLNRPILAVGAAFSFWAGTLPMAPAWMQRTGLEWLFRWSREPRRLAGRYLIYNPLFIAGVVRQKLEGRVTPSVPAGTQPPLLRYS